MTSLVRKLQGWHVAGVTFVVATAFCGLIVETMLEARRDNWARASQSARNLARAMAEEMERTVESLDLSIRGVVDNSRVPGVMDLEPVIKNMVLFDRAATAKSLGFLLLLDADGNVSAAAHSTASMPGSFADRSYFVAHRSNPKLDLYISEPFRSRISGNASIALSRRVPDQDGGFAGVAVGTIRLDAVRELFATMDLGAQGSITLFHSDGTLVMRVPYRDAFIGSDVSASDVFRQAMPGGNGQFVAVSPRDGTQKLHTFASVDQTPLRVAVSLPVDDIEAGWLRHALFVGFAALAIVLILAVAAAVLGRQLRKRQEAEAATRESEANFRLLAENCGDMVSRVGPDGIRRYVSPASARLLGRRPDQLVGLRPQEEVHPNDLEAVTSANERLQQQDGEETTVSYRVRRADGAWIWVESTLRAVRDPATGQLDGVVAVSRDVTERKKVETALAQLAVLDGLTGIANRRGLDEALAREWRRCARAELPLSLLLVDVDRFKALNDSQGHQRGDECLRQIGEIIGTTVRRASDFAARYGGEEFAVMLPETDAEGAAAVAERVRAEVEALAFPNEAGGVAGGVVTVSVGGATLWPVPEEQAGPVELIRMADQCMYEAKRSGRNRTVHDGASSPLQISERS